ncbi:non-ribosomal peptide synthetase [Gillisia sp. Hel_I_29]|uniref:non-ribosomal peptide synthetase n=1 Tax=Gillisia sp. Hel_I_29 TaxID=1249975 RepID=UPI0005509D96|nr:non-ribosomal peptide synthetase [Gillisia sp. Hel_I_29]
MNIIDFILELKEKDIEISLENNKLKIYTPEGKLPSALIDQIKFNKKELIAYLSNIHNGLQKNKIEILQEQANYSLSSSQRRLWVLSQFEGGSSAYNMPSRIFLDGSYDVDLFKRAIYSVVDRHEILRTVFKENSQGEIRQWILERDALGFEIGELDLQGEADIESSVLNYLDNDRMVEFDLAKGPLLRAILLQVSEDRYVFYYNMHHIISDGWSMDVLSRDVFKYYEFYKSGGELDLPALRIQYKDYASWQLSQLSTSIYQGHRDYWTGLLGGDLPVLDLPSSKVRPVIQSHQGQLLRTYISKESTQGLKRFSHQEGGTLFMGLLSSLKALLYRYTGQEDLVVGTPVAGREHSDLEDQIGFYINTLALRNEVRSEDSFEDLFRRVRQRTLDAYEHQGYPFDRLVEDLELRRDTSRSAVFDMMLVLQNTGDAHQGIGISDSDVELITDQGFNLSKFDLSFTFEEQGDYLALSIKYNTDVYDKAMLEGFIVHYKEFLASLLSLPEASIGGIDYLEDQEREELLDVFNATEVAYPEDKTVVELFEEQVSKTPEAIAVVYEEERLSYEELNRRSNQLAHYLQAHYTIEPDDLVGIMLPRSSWMIVGILGILKSGGAYVPIDPDYPENRIAYMLKDSNCKVLLDEVFLDEFKSDSKDYNTGNPSNDIGSNNLVYVIYTSGSTGKPKGVEISHNSLINYNHWLTNTYDIGINDSSLVTSGISFDGILTSIYGCILNGGTLHLLDKFRLKDPLSVIEYIESTSISYLKVTPTYLNLLLQGDENNSLLKIKTLRLIFTGGERANISDIAKIIEGSSIRLVNHYGPTESTIGSCVYDITNTNLDDFLNRPRIGAPISNTEIYILNREGLLQPVGVTGELYIAGSGLARGYLNNELLTKERFVSNPFKEGTRMYKTGDLGRWNSDGTITFLGREDAQVKIRGYRIELGEIESVLLGHADIDEAVVLANDNDGVKELVAYFVSSLDHDSASLRSYLKGFLPDYMLPSYYVAMEGLPLTPNGKIDRRSLPSPEGLEISHGVEYVAPRNDIEHSLVKVWEEVLKREGIGVKDNFYNLGGDSIKSIQVVSRLRQYGYSTKVEHILRNPVLEDLVSFITKNVLVIDQSEVLGPVGLTPIQLSFFEDATIVANHHYNQSVLLFRKEGIESTILASIFSYLAAHHDALRMVYSDTAGSWVQQNLGISDSSLYDLYEYDISSEFTEEQIKAQVDVLQSSIDLSTGPLIKLGLFHCEDGDRLLIVIHHLVIDGVSWRILLEDFSTLYEQSLEGSLFSLPMKTDSYQGWSSSLLAYGNSRKLSKERSYWELQIISFEFDFPNDVIEEGSYEIGSIGSVSFGLSQHITELLQTRVHDVYNTEINDILLTGLILSIDAVLKTDRSVLLMEGHGREDTGNELDFSRTIGWFTSTYPFLLELKGSGDIFSSLVSVKDDLRRLPDKGFGYGVLKYFGGGFSSRVSPSITFNYLGDFGSSVSSMSRSKDSVVFEYGSGYTGNDNSELNSNSSTPLGVSGMIVKNVLQLSISYDRSQYKEGTINALSESYQNHLELLIEGLSKEDQHYLTSSDLTFKGLSSLELSVLNKEDDLEDVYRLSPLQEGIYYHWLSGGINSSVYFEQMSYRLEGEHLDIESLRLSYDLLVSRHAILRTSFSNDYAGESLQIVRKSVSSNFVYEKADAFKSREDQESYLQEYRKLDRDRGFDLGAGSQMRLTIVQLSPSSYEFIWSHHHILIDGWCMSILINDFYKLLYGVQNKRPVTLSPVSLYSSYISWLEGLDKDSSLSYWSNYLSGYDSKSSLPFVNNRLEGDYSQKKEHLLLEGDLLRSMQLLCRELSITENSFIQGVWGYLLSRYNNTRDVVFGAVVSGRPDAIPGIEDMVGLFINTIPVRIQYTEVSTAKDLLEEIQQGSIASLPHHYLNLSEVQSQSPLGMDLLDHIMMYANYAIRGIAKDEINKSVEQDFNIAIASETNFDRTSYDFGIQTGLSDNEISIKFVYNEGKYRKTDILNVREHFLNVFKSYLNNPNCILSEIDYLSRNEKQELLVDFQGRKEIYPADKTVVDLFEEQVLRTPDAIAVVFEGVELSYSELNTRSNQLAHYLSKKHQLSSGDFVGVMLERSDLFIISILGILKNGGVYVPIDLDYPEDRKLYFISETSLKTLIIDSSSMLDVLNFETNILAIDIELDELFKEESDTINLSKSIDYNDLAYVIYTSGSTGAPKGVMIEHGGIVNTIVSQIDELGLDGRTRGLQFASSSFDASVWEVLLMLLSGGALYIINSDQRWSPELIEDFIISHSIDIATIPPSYLSQLNISKLSGLSKLITAGEAAIYEKVVEFLNYGGLYFNAYGPTESSICATIFKVSSKDDVLPLRIPIGSPISNTSIYILGAGDVLQPIGVVGEICIGGVGLARGYLNRPDLTLEKFFDNPFKEGERLYRTGDLGKWHRDGNIEFLGRKDDQVKIRGYRVELGEIESVLLGHSEIDEAVVLAKDLGGTTELIAYLVSGIEQDSSTLRSYLKGFLPDYMLPSYYVSIVSMPLTPNGKIDKKGLPSPEGIGIEKGVEYVAPRTETEQQLVSIWEEVLGREDIGVKDDFFELGGQSLKVIKLVSLIKDKFEVEITINQIFSDLNIQNLSQEIQNILWLTKSNNKTDVTNKTTI